MPFVSLDSHEPWERRPGWRGRFFRTDEMTFAYWDFKAGSDIHPHHHDGEEVWNVIEGELDITVNEQTQRVRAGMAAIVPDEATHSVVALSDGRAIVVSHPVRDDVPYE